MHSTRIKVLAKMASSAIWDKWCELVRTNAAVGDEDFAPEIETAIRTALGEEAKSAADERTTPLETAHHEMTRVEIDIIQTRIKLEVARSQATLQQLILGTHEKVRDLRSQEIELLNMKVNECGTCKGSGYVTRSADNDCWIPSYDGDPDAEACHDCAPF